MAGNPNSDINSIKQHISYASQGSNYSSDMWSRPTNIVITHSQEKLDPVSPSNYEIKSSSIANELDVSQNSNKGIPSLLNLSEMTADDIGKIADNADNLIQILQTIK